jgi:lipopolysaccharide cholinephosphotransferase
VLALFNFKKLRVVDFVPRVSEAYEKDLLPLKEIEFEGKMFPCPANPDAYLKTLYGDYMQLPPEKDRSQHTKTIIIYD